MEAHRNAWDFPNSSPVGVTRQQPYSYVNPPRIIDDAMKRIDELEVEIGRVEADLASRTERSMASADFYDSWRVKATRARNHFQREATFLKGWIDRTVAHVQRGQKIATEIENARALLELSTDYLASASPYAPLFTDSNLPTISREVTDRKHELIDLKLAHAEFMTHLRMQSNEMRCSTQAFRIAKAGVVTVMDAMDRELSFLGKVTRGEIPACRHLFEGSPRTSKMPRREGRRLEQVNLLLQEVKTALDMNSTTIAIWLFEAISDQVQNLQLTPDQRETLAQIGQFVELTKERFVLERRN